MTSPFGRRAPPKARRLSLSHKFISVPHAHWLRYTVITMLLTESEGKELLQRAGLQIPRGMLIRQLADLEQVAAKNLAFPIYAKAQVLHGNREVQGLIIKVENHDQIEKAVSGLLDATDQYRQPIIAVLLEESISVDQQIYLSLSYDTRTRRLIAYYSPKGGTGMDDRGETLQQVQLSVLNEPVQFPPAPELLPVVQQLWQCFLENDAVLVEVNPLVRSGEKYYCLDAKIELEDIAASRHTEWSLYGQRNTLGRPPTELELRAREVSQMDHRGAAGESFFEFINGDVGVLASGGGASQLAMDALMAAGIRPANYTEYSGNPPREKVKALTEVVLSIPNLRGLYVVGSNASFTDIYETLAGVVDSLLESAYVERPGFAVLIRRGGPRWQEAFEMVKERLAGKRVNLKLFGPDFPVVDTAAEMKDMLDAQVKE